MSDVRLLVEGFDPFAVRAFEGTERLGESPAFEVEVLTTAPIVAADLVGKLASIAFGTGFSSRALAGLVTKSVARMTSNPASTRVYKVTVRPRLALLELRRRSRIFQNLSAPDIVKKIAGEIGYAGASLSTALAETYAPREYVVQYDETDAAFVRRMCEEHGLWFRFGVDDHGKEVLVLEDRSSNGTAAPFDVLPLVEASALAHDELCAFHCSVHGRRRPGKVTVRDYAFEKPALALEASTTAGNGAEQEVEVYRAPFGFKDPSAGSARAKLLIESLRADTTEVTFATTAFEIAPGMTLALEAGPNGVIEPAPPRDLFVVEVRHAFRDSTKVHACEVRAIPKKVPFRLARRTPRPWLAGVQTAIVTGAAGEEIHVEGLGRVKVQFPWDLEGKSDDKTTLPIRVMQPNTPGSMALPRVGWEVVVAFEQGDPDRPLVLGRLDNGKHPPPYALPANKTVTAVQTSSSPKNGKLTSIRFDDAAGKQHIYVQAPFAKTTTVSNDMMTQTAKNENLGIGGSQSRSVGGPEKVSVTQAYLTAVGSQSAMVGATQKIYVAGKNINVVDSETVVIGGALLEKVGNPVTGLKNLGKAAVLSGVGALGTVGTVVSAAGGAGLAAYDGYQKGGWKGALKAGGTAVGGTLAGLVPGGDAVFNIATDSAQPAPWRDGHAAGPDAAGGGGTGATDDAAAAGPGPGHRNTLVKSSLTELVGAGLAIVTPGTVGWYTVGAATYLIGGSKTVKAGRGGISVLGASTETLGSLKIDTKAGTLRDVKGPITTTIGGSSKSDASGKHTIKSAASVTIKVGGSIKVDGSKVSFAVGSSTVTATADGVLVEADEITLTGASKQTGATGHT